MVQLRIAKVKTSLLGPIDSTYETYQSFLEQLKETDTVVAVAAGNAGTWADGAWNGHLYSDSVSLDMVGFPGS